MIEGAFCSVSVACFVRHIYVARRSLLAQDFLFFLRVIFSSTNDVAWESFVVDRWVRTPSGLYRHDDLCHVFVRYVHKSTGATCC